MKIIRTEILIDAGGFSESAAWHEVQRQITEAIRSVQWPPHSGSFTLHDQAGKKRGEGSGVKPIKEACMRNLSENGWSLETSVDIGTARRPGKMDATRLMADRLFCVEWETGNISSSHRALNKMAIGLLEGILVGGVLIVPTRAMYKYLTDRIGNFRELEPYFPLWRSVPVRNGILAVIAIEHDAVSMDVPRIAKGTDGRALQ